MTSDITRRTFDPAEGFTTVQAQQGRVMLDADHNEAADIQRHDTRSGRRDIVGPEGAPADAPGFGVTVEGGVPTLSDGRFMLDGIRLESSAAVPLGGPQPFFPAAVLPEGAGEWLAYLEAWEQPVTAVEAPHIREGALGGPDTTTRERLVWQVRWLRLANNGTGTTCATARTRLAALANEFDGTLQPLLDASTLSGPCIVSEAADLRILENQAFRFEIHDATVDANGNPLAGPATFKWSRDNGSVIGSAIGLVSSVPIVLTVDRLGPGGAEGFTRGAMIEIASQTRTLNGRPGILARIEDVAGDALTLSLLGGAPVGDLEALLGETGVIVRRWDSIEPVTVAPGTVQTIEAGLQVRFSNGRFRTGDHWLIPGRTAVVPGRGTQLDWPSTGGVHAALRSQGPVRHRAALAILERAGNGTWTFLRDCRPIFPPLTSVLTLAKVGGEGQSGASLGWLPAPLSVLALRGLHPASGLTLRYTVASGGGQLSATDPAPATVGAGTVDVTTTAQGRAAVFWRLGTVTPTVAADTTWEPAMAQRVEVALLGPDGAPMVPPQVFTAQVLNHRNLSIVGGNAQHGRPGERLEVALRARVDEGARVVSGQAVEFSILNQVFEGQSLDQKSGGVLLASARFVSGETWPGGSAHHTVRTSTDADGVAQVQWTLGDDERLTTQRVEARLVNSAGDPTPQRGLYTAQLAIASETSWRPNVPWLASTVGATGRNVQATIDAIAQRLEEIGAGTSAFDPFTGLQWRRTNGTMAPLGPDNIVPLANFAALSFRPDIVPQGRPNVTYPHGGVVVSAEVPDAKGGLIQISRLNGNVRRGAVDGRMEWTLSSESRGALNRLLGASDDGLILVLRIAVVPRWMPGGQPSDSVLSFESAFRIAVTRMVITPLITVDGLISADLIDGDITRGGVLVNGRFVGGFLNRRG